MNEIHYEQEKETITMHGFHATTVSASGQQLTAWTHIHTSLEILFCAKGSICVKLDDEMHYVNAGEMILVRPNTVHNVFSLSEGENVYHVLMTRPSVILNIASVKNRYRYTVSLITKNPSAKTVWKREECADAFLRIEDILRELEGSDYGADVACNINVIAILLQVLRDTRDDRQDVNASDDLIRRIYDAMTYINRHYAEDITAKALCQKASLSYNYFSNVFKKITGFDFKDYLINTRISHAEQELLTTDKPVTEIATACGFNNTSYFISTFKRLKKVTPTELRKTLKKSDVPPPRLKTDGDRTR